MAKRSQKRSRKGASRQGRSAPPPRRRRDGKAALKGIGFGLGFFVVLTFLAIVKVGGDTPFNHVIKFFDSPETKTEAKVDSAVRAKDRSPLKKKLVPKAAPSRRQPSTKSKKPSSVSTNARTAPPLEKLSDSDKAGLDDLIKSKDK